MRVKIDPRAGEADNRLADTYGVEFVPDLRILNADGKERSKLTLPNASPDAVVDYFLAELRKY